MADIDPKDMAGQKGKNGKGRTESEALPRPNRWASVFGTQAVFKSVARAGGEVNKPLVLNDGSTQTRLAHAVIPFVVAGAYIAGAYIVRRKFSDGNSVLRLQWPSSGGKFKTPMLDVADDEHSANDLLAFGDAVVDQWKVWRRLQIANGAAAAQGNVHGVGVSEDELAELGLS